jgi:hypothetical protein
MNNLINENRDLEIKKIKEINNSNLKKFGTFQ